MRFVVPLAAALGLITTGCAGMGGARDAAPSALAASLVGTWDNASQMETAPPHVRGESPPGGFTVPPRSLTLAPAGADALAATWRRGGTDPAYGGGEIVALEHWRFLRKPGGTVLEIAAAGVLADPACALAVTPTGGAAFDTASDPTTCLVVAPDGRRLGLERRITVTTTGMLHQETYFEGDEVAYRVPGAAPFELRKP